MLLDAGAKPLFVCRQTGTSLEMIEKHYGDARVDADQLDEMIGELESPTGNLPGTLPDAGDDSLPSKVKEPFVFYGVPRRAGDRGRTGDVQLGKLAFYQLNYARESQQSDREPQVRIELTTARLRIGCSTSELLWQV